MSNSIRSVFYIGVTSGLYKRVYEHKYGEGSTFTRKYKCTDLIYYEFYSSIEEAIAREKQLKKWKRAWKEELVRKMNPELKDLFDDVEEM